MTKTRKVKDNSFVAIQAFMVNDLELKGNDLFIYAIIYGFCQDGESCFSGGLSYLCAWTNSSKQGVMNSLNNLIDKKLITKKELFKDNVKYCEYRTTKLDGVYNKVDQGYATKLTGGGQISLPNNILDNISNNIINNTEEKKVEEPVPPIPSVKSARELEMEKSFDEAISNIPSSPLSSSTTKKKSNKRKNVKSGKKTTTCVETDDFYKPIYEAYRSAFFNIYPAGTIPNCGKYKTYVDSCIKRYSDLDFSHEQIRDMIILAIDSATHDDYIIKNRFPFAMITSESVMPRLINTTSSKDAPQVGIDFDNQEYGGF